MRRAISSNAKPSHAHSGKDCACGSHNAKNVKKNLNHHSTKSKHDIREERDFKEKHRE